MRRGDHGAQFGGTLSDVLPVRDCRRRIDGAAAAPYTRPGSLVNVRALAGTMGGFRG